MFTRLPTYLKGAGVSLGVAFKSFRAKVTGFQTETSEKQEFCRISNTKYD